LQKQEIKKELTEKNEDRGILMLPSTNKIYKLTKREFFERRMNQMDRPLVILNFQGVLGDFVHEKMPVEKGAV
jgi:predicted RNA-binding protein YlxR (DUF448 family)